MMKKLRMATMLLLAVLLAAGCSNTALQGATPSNAVDVLDIGTASEAAITTPAPEAAASPSNVPQGELKPVSDVTMGDGEIAGLTQMPAEYVSSRSLFPEGATEETAEYAFTVTLPTFPTAPQDKAELYSIIMNAADVLSDDALTRVTEERLPLSDRADGAPVPETVLTVKAYSSGNFTELVALETWTFDGTDKNERLSASVFTVEGVETALSDLVGGYDARELAAQQVYNVIDREDGAFYNDISLEDIALALDTYNGFVVTDNGIVILFAPGSVAPEEALTQRVLISRESLWPDVVNDAILTGLFTADEYSSVLPALRSIACAVSPNYESFSASAPGAYSATAFMTQILTKTICIPCSPIPFITMDKAEYESIYAGYFASPMPDIKADPSSTDGTVISEDGTMYSVPLTTLSAYAFRPESCAQDGDALVLSGAILSGVEGEGAQESVIASAQLRLIKNPAAAAGFYIDAVTLD